MFGNRNNGKITDDGGTGNTSPRQLEIYKQCVREYEQGKLTHMEGDNDHLVQSVYNEIKVRAIDDARHGKRR